MVKDWAARHQSVPTNLDLVLGKMGKVTEVIDNEIAHQIPPFARPAKGLFLAAPAAGHRL